MATCKLQIAFDTWPKFTRQPTKKKLKKRYSGKKLSRRGGGQLTSVVFSKIVVFCFKRAVCDNNFHSLLLSQTHTHSPSLSLSLSFSVSMTEHCHKEPWPCVNEELKWKLISTWLQQQKIASGVDNDITVTAKHSKYSPTKYKPTDYKPTKYKLKLSD